MQLAYWVDEETSTIDAILYSRTPFHDQVDLAADLGRLNRDSAAELATNSGWAAAYTQISAAVFYLSVAWLATTNSSADDEAEKAATELIDAAEVAKKQIGQQRVGGGTWKGTSEQSWGTFMITSAGDKVREQMGGILQAEYEVGPEEESADGVTQTTVRRR